jgi:hypothetical protein
MTIALMLIKADRVPFPATGFFDNEPEFQRLAASRNGGRLGPLVAQAQQAGNSCAAERNAISSH